MMYLEIDCSSVSVTDSRVRERLLREDKLTLTKTLEICTAAEVSKAQIKAVNNLMPPTASSAVSEVHTMKPRKQKAAVVMHGQSKSSPVHQSTR